MFEDLFISFSTRLEGDEEADLPAIFSRISAPFCALGVTRPDPEAEGRSV